MAKTLVMYRLQQYGIEDVEDVISLQFLQDGIKGYPEVAMKCMPNDIGNLLPGCEGEPGMMIFCDEEGKLKDLEPSFIRPTDGDTLVGKLYWVCYKDIQVEYEPGYFEPDMIFTPLTEKMMAAIILKLKKWNWNEVMFDERNV